MSVSDLEFQPDDMSDLTDREILEAIYASQLRVEILVGQTVAEVKPTLEKFTRGGIMGLLGGR